MTKNANMMLRELYLDYVNNYLTLEIFAEHHELSDDQALDMLRLGSIIHEDHIKMLKNTK